MTLVELVRYQNCLSTNVKPFELVALNQGMQCLKTDGEQAGSDFFKFCMALVGGGALMYNVRQVYADSCFYTRLPLSR